MAPDCQGHLRVWAIDDDAGVAPFEYRPELGQEFLTAIYPVFAADLGYLIWTEWEWGASSQKTMVFRLSESNKFEVVFEGVCRFGHRMLNLSGSDVPDICGGYGDLFGEKEMRVFSWHNGRFELTRSIRVPEPHRYLVTTSEK